MLRYSLASLAAVIVCLSIYSAALAHGDGVWPQISVTLTVSILLFTTLAAVFCRSRTFVIGFSIVGWLYFAIVFFGFTGSVRESLLTQTAINWLYGQVHAPAAQGVGRVTFQPTLGPLLAENIRTTTAAGAQPTITFATLAAPTPVSVNSHYFAQIGHSLWAVLIGTIGGVVAQVLRARSRKQQTSGESA